MNGWEQRAPLQTRKDDAYIEDDFLSTLADAWPDDRSLQRRQFVRDIRLLHMITSCPLATAAPRHENLNTNYRQYFLSFVWCSKFDYSSVNYQSMIDSRL